MLVNYTFLDPHAALKLNEELIVFFNSLTKVTKNSKLDPCTQHFSIAFAKYINKAPSLKEKFNSFFKVFVKLKKNSRSDVISKFLALIQIKDVLENKKINGYELKLSSLPKGIRKETKDLFSYMYPLTLNSKGNLKKHYQDLYKDYYDSRNLKVCPFCGIEHLFPPHIRRQDYDHILKQEDYIFATVNLRNLVPMGRDCNEVFKARKDVLYGKSNKRRKFAYPYETSFPIEVSLTGTLLPGHSKSRQGSWKIKFQPNNEFVKTWNDVFAIDLRYRDMILTRYYKDWLDQFVNSLRIDKTKIKDQAQLKSQLNKKAKLFLDQPLLDNGIVKGAFFKFLAGYTDRSLLNALKSRINS